MYICYVRVSKQEQTKGAQNAIKGGDGPFALP
jgi:hypothetical protein